ncbi:hypothetical protein JOM56_015415 [Amanita muscaria]
MSVHVSARGVDYPEMTRVIQVGIPTNKDWYVHRIGQTGRDNFNQHPQRSWETSMFYIVGNGYDQDSPVLQPQTNVAMEWRVSLRTNVFVSPPSFS